jgi:hypothetical protein
MVHFVTCQELPPTVIKVITYWLPEWYFEIWINPPAFEDINPVFRASIKSANLKLFGSTHGT